MAIEPLAIAATNLSVGWALAFMRAVSHGVQGLEPLVFTLTGFDNAGNPAEDANIRRALDEELLQQGTDLSVLTVANTIFPESLWRRGGARAHLYERYERILPLLHRDRRNRHGLYFQRLTQFGSGPVGGNQLEHIIRTYANGNHRRTALQAAIFDPAHDHTNQRRRGFPCLQQVGFSVDEDGGGLSVHGLYTTQYLFERAYGNYLGLARLGHFMATELRLRLARMTCFVGHADLGGISKERLGRFGGALQQLVGDPPRGATMQHIGAQ